MTPEQEQEHDRDLALEHAVVRHRYRSRRHRGLDTADRAADWTDAEFDAAVRHLLAAAATHDWGPDPEPVPPDPSDEIESVAWAPEHRILLAQLAAEQAAAIDDRGVHEDDDRDLRTLRTVVARARTRGAATPWWETGPYAGPPPF